MEVLIDLSLGLAGLEVLSSFVLGPLFSLDIFFSGPPVRVGDILVLELDCHVEALLFGFVEVVLRDSLSPL